VTRCAGLQRDGRRCGAPPIGGLRRKRERTVVGAYELEGLASIPALRRLLEEVALPLGPALGPPALAVASALVKRVPCYRMEWTPAEPPWARLAEALRTGGD